MSEKDRLLKLLDEEREEMRSMLERIDPGKEIYPDWNMRENIAHITGWDEVAEKSLRALIEGGEPYLMPPKSFDMHNEDILEARKEMDFEEVLREWEATRDALKATIAELSDEKLERWITYPWGFEGTVKDMLFIIADHEAEHARELIK